MARPRKDRRLSETDFAWFDLSRYAPLESGDLRLWSQALLQRIELARLLKNGETEFVADQFTQIKADPLGYAGFSRSVKPTGKAAIKPLTTGQVLVMSDSLALDSNCCSASQTQKGDDDGAANDMPQPPFNYAMSIDDLARQIDPTPWRRYAHVVIDLYATDDQLTANFAACLDEWRQRVPLEGSPSASTLTTKAKMWAKNRLVPYFDMQMYAALEGKEIPRPVLQKKFERRVVAPTGGEDIVDQPTRSQLDELRLLSARVFTEDYLNVFKNAVAELPQ